MSFRDERNFDSHVSRAVGLTSVALLHASLAWAQPAPASTPASAPSARTLPTVVVTGAIGGVRRLADAPYAISVVDDDAIRSAGPMVNLSEALSRVPGLSIANRGNYAQDLQISSRGFGARAAFGVRGLRLYTDGIPASMPDGSGSVTHFDLAGASRIEVLRGPFSVLYGSSSGGVISLWTDPATERKVGFDVDIGSFGLRQERLRLEAPMGGGWDLRASVSRFEIQGFRPHSEATRNLSNLRLGYTSERDRIVILASDITQNANDPLGLTRQQIDADPDQTTSQALQFDTRKTARQSQAGVRWQHRFDQLGPLVESAVTTYHGSRGVGQWQSIPVATQAPAAQAGGVIDFDRAYDGLDWRLTWRWDRVDLVTGVSAEAMRDDRQGYENFIGSGASQKLGVTGRLRRDEGNKATTRDAFAQAEFKLGDSIGATVGVRTGRVDFSAGDRYVVPGNGDDSGRLSFSYTNPVAGLRWTVQPGLVVHASVARGFEAPTLAELAYRASGAGLNDALRPQRSRQAELGVRWSRDRLETDATLFRVDTKDEIGVQSNNGGRSTYQNVGATRRSGAEASMRWKPVQSVQWLVALTWLNATYVDGFSTPTGTVPAGNRISGTARKNAFTEIAWQPFAGLPTTVALEARAQGRMVADDANSDYAGRYAEAALRASHQWALGAGGSKLELLARVDNLTDRRHVGSVIVNDANRRFFEPAPPRNALVSLRFERPW